MNDNLVNLADRLRDDEPLRCPTCDHANPRRIEGTVCSECAEFPKCLGCGTWVGNGSGFLPGYVLVLDENGDEARMCDNCWKDVT